MQLTQEQRFVGCLLGLAAGDAVGTSVEFKSRGTFPPVQKMTGGGPFELEAGQWTDDTSMALCLATSLTECRGFDARDQMTRYCRWRDEGYFSPTGHCFDIGNTVNAALQRFKETGEPFAGSTHPYSAGNGSIMRLAPVPMYWFPDGEVAEKMAAESSRPTHAAPECLDACRLFARMLIRALSGADRDSVLFADSGEFADSLIESPQIGDIARGTWRNKTEAQIRGSGYVVQSLEAALWCFWSTESFEAAILKAVNLGDDADTTAAVCGQIAGAYYGEPGIPEEWCQKLAMREEIRALAVSLMSPV